MRGALLQSMNTAKHNEVKHWAGHSVNLLVGALRWIHCDWKRATFADIKSNIEAAELAADLAIATLSK